MPQRSWPLRFRNAIHGVVVAVVQERTFAVHIPATIVAVGLGYSFGIDRIEWFVLLLCISHVITAELLNTALERMAKAVTSQRDEHVGTALDMGAGAVLVASLGAAIAGTIIFGPRLLHWWSGAT